LELGSNREPDKFSFVKPRIAKISLVVSAILFVTGFGVLCACPGWYALAAAFAGGAVWAGTRRTRRWAVVWLITCLIFTALDTFIVAQKFHKLFEGMRVNAMKASEQTNAAPK